MSWNVVSTIEPWTGSHLVSDEEYYSMLQQGIVFSATPTSDAVVPGSLLPATEGEVGALSDKIDNQILTQFNVKDYGAAGDGVTDDYAAIKAAVDATQAAGTHQGGIVYFPPGIYACGTFLSFKGYVDVILMGAGGRATVDSGTASILRYTGNDTTNFVDLRSSLGTAVRDLQISHAHSFTGRLIDVRNAQGAGVLANDATMVEISNCSIVGTDTFRTAIGVDVDKSTRVLINKCAFINLAIGVRGKSIQGSYANEVIIDRSSFQAISTIGIRNPGRAWFVNATTFDGSPTSVANAMDHDSGVFAESLSIYNCWTNPATVTSGTQFRVAGTGIDIRSNFLSATGGACVYIDDLTVGLNISANNFNAATTAVSMVANASHARHTIMGNSYTTVTTNLSGTLQAGIDDSNGTLTFYGLVSIPGSFSGSVPFAEGANMSFGTATGTKIGTSAAQLMGFWNHAPVAQPSLDYGQSTEVQTNVILNGSFDANVTSWSGAAGALNTGTATISRITTDQAPYDDVSAASCNVAYAAQVHGGIVQTFVGVASTTYRLTAYVKNVAGRPVNMQAKDTSATPVTGSLSNTAAVGGGWTRLTTTLTTGVTATPTVSVTIMSDGTSGTGNFIVDEIRVGSVISTENWQTAIIRRLLAKLGLLADNTA